MHGNRKHIDDLFRNGLKGLREKPPVHAWKRLEEDLAAIGTGRRMFFIRLAAASVLILFAFGAGYYFAIYSTSQDREQLSNNRVQPENPVDSYEIAPKTGGEQRVPGTDIPENALVVNEDAGLAQRSSTPQNPIIVKEASTELLLASAKVEESGPDPSVMQGTLDLQRIDFVDINTLALPLSEQRIVVAASEPPSDNLLIPYPIYDYSDSERGVKSKKYQYKWSVGAQFAPTYSYRDISINYGSGGAGNPSAGDTYDAIEDPLMSYAGGLQVDYRVSGNWRLESGVYFSRIGQVNNNGLEFEQNNSELILTGINTSTGGINIAYERVPEDVKRINSPKDTIGLGGVENATIVQQFDLFEIPFLVKYKMLNRKFSMHVSGGLSPAYLVDNNTYLEMEDRKYDVGDAGNLNTMIVNTSFGLGFEYLITKKLSINLEPTFRYALSPLNNNSSFSYHPYYLSWFTGIRLRID
jgi:hypothetical protein